MLGRVLPNKETLHACIIDHHNGYCNFISKFTKDKPKIFLFIFNNKSNLPDIGIGL